MRPPGGDRTVGLQRKVGKAPPSRDDRHGPAPLEGFWRGLLVGYAWLFSGLGASAGVPAASLTLAAIVPAAPLIRRRLVVLATVTLTSILPRSAFVLATFLYHVGWLNRLVAQPLIRLVVVARVLGHVVSKAVIQPYTAHGWLVGEHRQDGVGVGIVGPTGGWLAEKLPKFGPVAGGERLGRWPKGRIVAK